MNTNSIAAVLASVAVVIAIGSFFKPVNVTVQAPASEASEVFGGSTRSSWTVSQNLSVGGDVSIAGGELTVPTTANATSSMTVGSLMLYSTSSATLVNVCLSTKGATGTFAGSLFFSYSTCAN